MTVLTFDQHHHVVRVALRVHARRGRWHRATAWLRDRMIGHTGPCVDCQHLVQRIALTWEEEAWRMES